MFNFGRPKQPTTAETPDVAPSGFQAGAVQEAPHPSTSSGQVQENQQTKTHRNPKNAAANRPSASYSALKTGSVSVLDLISPSSIEVDFRNIRVGDKFFRTFFVVDYPRQVSPNWLSILIDYK